MSAPRGSAILSEAWSALRRGEIQPALKRVTKAYQLIGRWSQGGNRLPIGWPEADRLIVAAARCVRGEAESSPPSATGGASDALLFSQWSPSGGHLLAATDIFRASPAKQKFVFIIDPGRSESSAEEIARRLGLPTDCVEVAPKELRDEPWRWLPARLAARGCARLFVVHETYRPGVLVAVLNAAATRAYILHHIDSKPCSGLHLPGVRVVELTPFCLYYSRRNLGIDPIYLPLVSEAPAGERPAFLGTGELRTATCGRQVKFAVGQGFAYAAVIAERLRRFGGRHIHVGDLSDEAQAMIAGALRRTGVDPERFEYLGRVPDLPSVLWANRVDLYIASFPAGGARTTIDVMASATPAILNLQGHEERHYSANLAPPGTTFWSTPSELWSILGAIDRGWLAERSRLAREHFERYHRRAILAEALARPDIAGIEPPPLPEDAAFPSPQDVLCQMLADITWLRRNERETRARLDALEKEISRAIRWPRWLRH